MRVVKFNVMCYATYKSELELPDDLLLEEGEVLDYVREHIPDAPVYDIEFLQDLDDKYEAVTMEDIKDIYTY